MTENDSNTVYEGLELKWNTPGYLARSTGGDPVGTLEEALPGSWQELYGEDDEMPAEATEAIESVREDLLDGNGVDLYVGRNSSAEDWEVHAVREVDVNDLDDDEEDEDEEED